MISHRDTEYKLEFMGSVRAMVSSISNMENIITEQYRL